MTLPRLLETPLTAETAPERVLLHPEDRVGLALALLAAGEQQLGQATLTDALEAADLDSDLRRRGQIELWQLLRRSGRMSDGVALLESMCATATRSRATDCYPYIELAKYYEHVARDYPAAEQIVERAQRLLDLSGQNTQRAELIHRLQRIRRKGQAIP